MKLEINKSIGLSLGFGGMIILIAALFNALGGSALLYLSLCMILAGIIVYSFSEYSGELSGIKNNEVWFKSVSSKGIVAWILGFVLTAFYVVIYWFPEYLGLNKDGNTGLVAFFDPLSFALNGHGASQWFVYGTLYTVAILGFGVKFILKYRHNTYQIVRTCSVMFFQLGFAFLLPEFWPSLIPN
jgi:hypothetical protein